MKLDVFISGEIIDLCIPTREFAEKSNWYSWLNDPKIARYTLKRAFPNTPALQVDFLEKQQKEGALPLIISNKKDYLGVVTLSVIDYIKRVAGISIIVDSSMDVLRSPLIALESIARISEHGFQVLGLDRIHGGQHINLAAGWQQRMELLGYRAEGFKRQLFVKGREVVDVIWIAAIYKDYLTIIKNRGQYWDSAKKMEERIKRLPKNKYVDSLREFMDKDGELYYKQIFSL
ncbi:hypothetical protein A2276_06165 [candidate division WOR-1 bacterium RIFOXYA12_FULL_43_27]|uniref:Uncharacterized protein n=1 Tax=candidate division WOR-1 bacterium RIFOXYC2_FULL_46_14 TaxID=1802587 RepID=A0A1F4U386_UNCSA|nr:MAG: hypothetical protein A2276_06165 [candidate division WOR-1 bacterium RIFOXYA12_FULL_43_27]OGC20240.1 MAG: hypothetical protein A2292_04165 [candidate division WOR-1 bacterium RIFOXYB2_FULL_46_45]OGC32021.1 MAG: hypothetical protein A2232_07280 [candidate division WOR-1 bacterium RIFOXYA2_FULL_46_56]OGC39424.1 MAG: hypothetical protein A2438_07645 [candidate division WOR-1 bacterium RIFOXYC2_FULL_46_14]